jgi:Phosphodiester glycosidase
LKRHFSISQKFPRNFVTIRKRVNLILLGLLGLISCISCTVLQPSASPIASSQSASIPAPLPSIAPQLHYQTHTLPYSTVHTLLIPAHGDWVVTPAVADSPATLETFVEQSQAIAALNGGFFDPVNGKSTSYVVAAGEPIADPHQNERLVNNPDLLPYLPQIFNRSEFRRYQCEEIRYAIVRHEDPTPPDCELLDALGAGPQLLPEMTAVQEAFVSEANGAIVRDALGSRQRNARTAIGITADGSVIWVMVQQIAATNSGMSFEELAQFMQSLGAVAAMNLDGGSSSALYYAGETHDGKLDSSGDRVQRPIKSVLLVQRRA